jgi:hypothetical protein
VTRWRGADEQRLPYRDSIRVELPQPHEGLVVTDLDLVLRCYGPRYATDDVGLLRLVEVKSHGARLTNGQRRTFGLLDDLCRASGSPRYCGAFVVTTDHDDWSLADRFAITRISDGRQVVTDHRTAMRWLNFEGDRP